MLGARTWFGRDVLVRAVLALVRGAGALTPDRPTTAHLPAWARVQSRGGSNGDVGIWHETYRIRPGDYECIYNNMPAFGLAKATRLVPVAGSRESAVGRLKGR